MYRKFGMVRQIILGLLVLTIISACATFNQRHPELKAQLEVEREEAFKMLNSWLKGKNPFDEDAQTLIQEITLLEGHPGWADLKPILIVAPSLQFVEGEIKAQRKITSKLEGWSGKWDLPWQDIVNKYQILVNRSNFLNEERLSLLNKWGKVENKWRTMTFLTLMLLPVDTRESFERSQRIIIRVLPASLKQYRLDSLGLLKKSSQEILPPQVAP